MSELLTFGETMVRLSPPEGERLSRADSLEVHAGGAESNVAAAAANLDADAEWLSVLPRTALGERIVHGLRGEGVTTTVTWTETGRVGTYYLEPGASPRGHSVRYDRGGTPIRDATAADLPLERVRDAEVAFTTGITPALSERAGETTASLLETATDAGTTTAFDVNYRAKLWEPARARTVLDRLFSFVDVLFVAVRDARDVLGYDGDDEAILRDIAADYEFETVILTRGEAGAFAHHDGSVAEQPAFPTQTVDPLGSGDALVGGFLAARLNDRSVADALAYGVATAALKRTIDGDMATVRPEEVETLLGEGADGGIDR